MPTMFECGNWSIDDCQTLRGPLKSIRLSPAKTAILFSLASSPNQVVRTDTFLRSMSSYNSIKVVVCRLRKHLAEAGADCRIEMVWGCGYRLVTDAVAMVTASFTQEEWNTVRRAVRVAEHHHPGTAALSGPAGAAP